MSVPQAIYASRRDDRTEAFLGIARLHRYGNLLQTFTDGELHEIRRQLVRHTNGRRVMNKHVALRELLGYLERVT